MGIDGFMFHDMLYWHTAPLSHPGSSLVYAANFNPIFSKLTALYNSPFSSSFVSIVSSFSVSVWLYSCLRLLACLHPSLTFSSICLSTPRSIMLERNCALYPVLLMKGSLFFVLCGFEHFRHITAFISMQQGNKGCSQSG